MKSKRLLNHIAIILAERQERYGDVDKNFASIAKRWSLILGITLKPEQVALCMLELKLNRLSNNAAHLDSITDVIGYAAALAELIPAQGELYAAR